MPQSWPRTASDIMAEIAERIGAPLDPQTMILPYDIEETALEMSMREVAGYIAAMHGGNWTVTDSGHLALITPAVSGEEDAAEVSAHNAEELSVSEPLEAWSGVKVFWDGNEWRAQDPDMGDDTLVVVKRGEQIGSAGDESGRVLTVKVAFGQRAFPDPAHLMDNLAQNILTNISGSTYYPFDARNVVLDPAHEIGDAVTLPDGALSMICALSGELDGLCAVDVSAPQDEALNSPYLTSWL